MRRDEIRQRLVALRPELEELHVRSIAVFGSVARDEAGPDSDIDLLVVFSETPDLFEFVRVQHRLGDLLGHPVDLTTPDALHPRLRAAILAEAVDAA